MHKWMYQILLLEYSIYYANGLISNDFLELHVIFVIPFIPCKFYTDIVKHTAHIYIINPNDVHTELHSRTFYHSENVLSQRLFGKNAYP